MKKVKFKNFCSDTGTIIPNYFGLFNGCNSLPDIDLRGVKSISYSDLFNEFIESFNCVITDFKLFADDIILFNFKCQSLIIGR